MAWVALLRADLALPPAESPSTRKISQFLGSLSEQSASLPGRLMVSRTDFLLVISLAFLAASLARWDIRDLLTTVLAMEGFCSRKYFSCSETILSVAPLASTLPSFCLVCPSNWGSSILMLMIAVMPSRISSPDRLGSLSFKILFFLPYSLKVLVRALRNPTRCMPPSGVLILLTKQYSLSV